MATAPRAFLLATFTTLALASSASAQLKTPAEFLGYELGDRFTRHHRVAEYVEHVAEQSPLVNVVQYGLTNEYRPLQLAFITDLQDADALEAARLNNLSLANLRDGDGSLEGARSIVWLSYNVHGNESVSTEAAMKVLFDLADPTNTKTKEWLKNSIIIIDPCINPDGRDRYVNWYNRTVGVFPNVDPADWAHAEPWPGGRTNHYFFDLNRDWAWATQKETRQRLKMYNRWMPHVHVDFHEQGVNNPYYFAPAARPYHEDITAWQGEMQEIVGRNNARYFDENNWLYFTKEVYDLFYPGYGDSWPTFNGAIGMTYEQAGSGRAGLGVETAEGDTLTLADRIAHHHATSLSTIEATSQNSDRVLSEFADYFRTGLTEPPGIYSAYVMSRRSTPDAAADMMELLDTQGIRYAFASADQSVRGFVYQDANEGTYAVASGDLVVPAKQPKARLVKSLFEPRSVLQDSLTYDITGWSLPYAFGTPAVATTATIATTSETPETATMVPPPDKPYAYIVEWKSVRDQQFVAALLRQKVNIRMASKPFTIAGRSYDQGSIVITRAGNNKVKDKLDNIVIKTANRFGQPVAAVRSGFVGAGSDFGSGSFRFIDAPSIALLGGANVSSSAMGQIWHHFDHVLSYPVTVLPAENLSRTSLANYDVIVMPGGNYRSVIGESGLAGLRSWVQGGGRLVAIDGAVGYLAGKKGFDLVLRKTRTDSTAVLPDSGRWVDESRKRISRGVTGSIYKVSLDATHPVGYGLGQTYFALKNSSTAYEPVKKGKGWNVGVVTNGTPVSGFAGYETVKHLTNSVAVASQGIGRGTVVYLVDNPLYRGFWRAGGQLFGNAVFAR